MECLNGAASVRTAELTVGGGAAPVHGLPLDCGRAAGGTEGIRHVAGRLSRREFRRTIGDGRRRGRAGAWGTFGLWVGGGLGGGRSLSFGAFFFVVDGVSISL